jgi:hypothetical protein
MYHQSAQAVHNREASIPTTWSEGLEVKSSTSESSRTVWPARVKVIDTRQCLLPADLLATTITADLEGTSRRNPSMIYPESFISRRLKTSECDVLPSTAIPETPHTDFRSYTLPWRPCSGIINDVRRRLPYYSSDWKDSWNYHILPATAYMCFAK